MNEVARLKFKDRMARRVQTEWVNYNKQGKFPNVSLYPTVGRVKWYFVIYDLCHRDYRGGVYFGKIHITDEYPSKSPEYTFLTPNGFYAIKEPIQLDEKEWQRNGNFIKGLLYLKQNMLSVDLNKSTIHYPSTSNKRKWYAQYSIKYNKQRYSPEFAQCFQEVKLFERK